MNQGKWKQFLNEAKMADLGAREKYVTKIGSMKVLIDIEDADLVGTKHSNDRTGDLGNFTREHVQVFFICWFAHVDDLDIAHRARCFEYRIITKKFMQAIDDVHPVAHSLKHQAPLMQGKHATGRRHAKYKVVRYRDGLLQRFCEVAANRNRIGYAV